MSICTSIFTSAYMYYIIYTTTTRAHTIRTEIHTSDAYLRNRIFTHNTHIVGICCQKAVKPLEKHLQKLI